MDEQTLFRSKFCMLENVNIMNKQSRNQDFLVSSVCLEFVCIDAAITSQWGIQAEA